MTSGNATSRNLQGWLNVVTGEFWPLPAGFKEPEWTVATEWERVYEGDEIVGPHSVRRARQRQFVARGRRFVMLRDLDTPELEPYAVLFENVDGSARLELFESAAERDPHTSKLRREFDSFEDALSAWSRTALCSATGEEQFDGPAGAR